MTYSINHTRSTYLEEPTAVDRTVSLVTKGALQPDGWDAVDDLAAVEERGAGVGLYKRNGVSPQKKKRKRKKKKTRER